MKSARSSPIKCRYASLVGRVAANKQMLSKLPNVAHAADRGFASAIRHEVFRLVAFFAHAFDNQIRFGWLKAGQVDVEANVDQVLKLDREHLVVPTRLFCQAIVRKNVGPLVGFAQMRQPHTRHGLHIQLLGRLKAGHDPR